MQVRVGGVGDGECEGGEKESKSKVFPDLIISKRSIDSFIESHWSPPRLAVMMILVTRLSVCFRFFIRPSAAPCEGAPWTFIASDDDNRFAP